ARQAVEAAEAELADERAILAEYQEDLDEVREVLVGRAVEAFIQPEPSGLDDMIRSSDIAEAARKQALLSRVAAHDADVLDQYRTIRVDFKNSMADAEAAERKAKQRRADVEEELASLEQ